ncbi:MAG: hypothetical protein AAFR73_09780 [Pseudomonadota bacterium]
MITTFLLGAIAGWVAAPAEERLKPFILANLPGATPSPAEVRAISLGTCLLVAAVLATLADGGGALALMLGGVLGVLGPRLYAKFKASRAPDYDN